MKREQPSHRLGVVLLALAFLTVTISLAFFLRRALPLKSKPNAVAPAATPLNVKLPFPLACAVQSSDAPAVYLALRKRDPRALKQLFDAKKFVIVKKGLPVRISNFGAVSLVTVQARAPHRAGICFVPADIVPAITKLNRQ